MADKPSYVCGLDLGQVSDFTAFAAVEVNRGPDPLTPSRRCNHFDVRHLERFPLGTPYADTPGRDSILASVRAALSRPPLPGCQMAVDQTGVGRPVVDLFRASSLSCSVQAVTITAGAKVERDAFDWRVPKKDLVGTMMRLMHTGRLRVAKGHRLTDILVRELAAFRTKITAAANETFGAWRETDHDDLLLAVALACWLGETCPPFEPGSIGFSKYRSPFAGAGFKGKPKGGW